MGFESAVARGVGEHLECSPCGTVTGPHGGIARMAWVLPEVLLSLLPKKMDYTQTHFGSTPFDTSFGH